MKTPKIRFKGDTEAWEQRKLGEVAQITMGQSPDGATYSDEPSDYILVQGNADLKDGWVAPRIWTTQKTKTCDAGDLIMSVRAPAGAMGKTAYSAIIGRGVAAIKGNEFLYQTLVKMDANGYWKKLSAGSTFESLNSANIINAEVMIPSDAEQGKIGDYFSNIDHLITLHQRKCEQTKKLKKFMLQKMFPQNGATVPEIRFEGFTEAWEQRKFGTIINETRERTTTENEDTLLSCAIAGMFLNSELFSHFRGSSNIGYLKVKKNDLILSAQNLHLGNCNVNLRFEHGIISPAYKVYELIDSDPLFIQAWLKQDSTKDFFLKASTEGASVCRKNIVWKELYKQTLPIPKLEEQTRIGEYFHNLDHLITLHQRKCDELQKMKKFMLQNMFV